MLIPDWLQITSHGCQLCGELKSKTHPLVEAFFKFESGLNWKIIARHHRTAEDLKDGKGFVSKVNIIFYWTMVFVMTFEWM
jgi:hypothetical protein